MTCFSFMRIYSFKINMKGFEKVKYFEKVKGILNKSWKILLIFSMVMSMIALKGNNSVRDVIAYSGYPKSVSIKYHGKLTYSGSTVGDFTVNGKQAFCMAHELPTPSNDTKMTAEIYDNATIKKVLYYGWSGPKQWSGFKSKAQGVVVTSLILSHYYDGDQLRSICTDFNNYIKSKKVPDYYVKFSTSSVNAYMSGTIQRTPSVTLNSGMTDNSVSVTLQNDVTYVDETHNKRQKGGTVKIYGKTKFHLEAPLTKNLGTWSTGNKSQGAAFAPVLSQTKIGKVQPIGYPDWAVDPMDITSLKVKWVDLGNLKLGKQEKETGKMVANTYFKVSYNKDMSNYRGIYKTGSNGYVTVNNLKAGTVYVQETSVPSHLILDKTVHEVTIQKDKTVSFTNKNNLKPTSLKLGKKDELGKMVAGVTFKVSKNSDMSNYRGIYKTESNGYVTLSNLLPGTYYVQEHSVLSHLVLDKTIHKVTVTYDKPGTFVKTNKLKRGNLKIGKKDELGKMVAGTTFKVSSNADMSNYHGIYKTGNNGYITISNLLPGTYYIQEMSVPPYLILDKTIHKVTVEYDKTVTFIKTNKLKKGKLKIGKKDELGKMVTGVTFKVSQNKDMSNYRGIYKTGDDGYVTLSNLLPGTYYVQEHSVPSYLILDKTIHKVIVEYDKQATFVKTNKLKRGNLKIGKKDELGKMVAGTTFKISSNADMSNYHGIYKTGNDGYVTISNLLPGTYYIQEISVPSYLILDKTIHKITVEYDKTVTFVKVNQLKSARLNISKFGEVLTDYKDGKFVYEMRKIAGMEVQIFAEEDIYDYREDKVYLKGSLVKTVMTGKDGSVTLELPLGKYRVHELKAPKGYVLTSQDQYVDLITANQEQTLIIDSIDFYDERQKVNVEAIKIDGITQQKLENAVIGLYAKEDIYNYQGKKIVEKDTLLSTKSTDKNGKINYNLDLPLVHFYLKEIKAPDGYMKIDKKYDINVDSKDQITKVYTYTITIVNNPKMVEISKKSLTGKDELKGAKLQIIDVLTKEIIEEWISTEKAYITDKLLVGRKYILREIISPAGYTKATDIEFIVNDNKDIQKITMIDEITKVDISKQDAINGKELSGNHLELRDENNNLIDEWISTDKPHRIEGLIVGQVYTLIETEAIYGYTIAQDVQFVVENTNEIQTVIMKNSMIEHEELGDEPQFIEDKIKNVKTNDETRLDIYLYFMGLSSIIIFIIYFKKERQE